MDKHRCTWFFSKALNWNRVVRCWIVTGYRGNRAILPHTITPQSHNIPRGHLSPFSSHLQWTRQQREHDKATAVPVYTHTYDHVCIWTPTTFWIKTLTSSMEHAKCKWCAVRKPIHWFYFQSFRLVVTWWFQMAKALNIGKCVKCKNEDSDFSTNTLHDL